MTEKDYVLDQIEKRKHFIENQKKRHDGTVSDEQRMKLEALETKCLNGEHDYTLAIDPISGKECKSCRHCLWEIPLTEKEYVQNQIECRKSIMERVRKEGGVISEKSLKKLEAMETKCLNGEHEFVIVQNSFHRDIIQCKYCMYEK